MTEDTIPVLIGAGQLTQREIEPEAAREPLEMMVETARRAAEDAGADPRLLARLDTVAVVNIIGWQYGNPPGLLAERLGACPTRSLYSTVGGNTPQWLVNELAAEIAAGRVRLALLAGAEAMRTLRLARNSSVTARWAQGGAGSPTPVGDPRPGSNQHELASGLQMPVQIYPLFENALRAYRGLSLASHRQQLGRLCSHLSAVAAENPYAWFRRARSAEEITTVTAENRMIAFPYPKYMNAIMDVDQSAAVLMTSVAGARDLGIHPSRWVYLRGCADLHDLWCVSERIDYHSSPAIRVAGEKALEMAGIGIDEVDYFDLYSCFPSAVQMARDALGISQDDPRPLTVTGGLAYHGGPGNNYTTHAIAQMMAKLRARPGSFGLVSALGWYITKHSLGVYSTEPPADAWRRDSLVSCQRELDRMPHPVLATEAKGRGTIETYTVLHDREGRPARGIVIGRLDDHRRFLASTTNETSVLEALMSCEAVGLSGTVRPSGETNRFDLA